MGCKKIIEDKCTNALNFTSISIIAAAAMEEALPAPKDMSAPFAGEVCFHNEDSPSFYWGNDAEFKCYLCQEVSVMQNKN